MSRQDELQALALTLAYDHASSVIESECVPVRLEEDDSLWFELSGLPDAEVDDCTRFLELRGLIEKRQSRDGKRTFVQIRDESEGER